MRGSGAQTRRQDDGVDGLAFLQIKIARCIRRGAQCASGDKGGARLMMDLLNWITDHLGASMLTGFFIIFAIEAARGK
jgi:hypothetical protein